jgi:choline-sulfatase
VIEELKRMALALGGGAAGAAAVAAVESRSVVSAASGAHAPTMIQLFLADLGVLLPLAVGVALAVAIVHLFLEPDRPRSLGEHAARVRAEPVFARSRKAALWPLTIAVAFAWTIATAHLARAGLATETPLAAGLATAVGAMALLGVLVACALAALTPLRRVLAAGAARSPRLVDPPTTGGGALAGALLVLIVGAYAGDTGGDGAWPLGIFGVLRRRELDLRPLVNLLVIAGAAYLTPTAFFAPAGRRDGGWRALAGAGFAAVALSVTVAEARGLDRTPHVARAIERYAPLGKLALAAARASTDRDRDGASALFAGGDCDDRDPRRSPAAIDVPGNGIDEDCSGADAPVVAPAPPSPSTSVPSARIPNDLNVIFITVDTLRADALGFMGYEKDTSPNLDRLAEKSVVFERAYAMASYTGKSVGPMLIGKYPNETDRDGGHFNTYAPSNVFLAERLKAGGVMTMGAASHWYFSPWSGLSQGISVWDLSARPSQGQGDNDTSITSSELAVAALKLLRRPDIDEHRFFMWLHFFDPHAQYMPHSGAPEFLGERRSPSAVARALYDGEVWFTDKHLGKVFDFVASQPWGERTAILLTADHGETFADHGMSYHGYELWEPLVRVPLLVYVPGLDPHRVPVKRGQIDIVPTILDLMKIEPPESGALRGVSLLPDLLAASPQEHVERDVYFDMPAGPFNTMRRGLIFGPTPGMKLISFGGGQYQLFDLSSDPAEKDDLAQDKARLAPVRDAFQALRAGLKEKDVKPDAPPPP